MITWLLVPVLLLTVAGYCWQLWLSPDLPRGTAVYRWNVLWQVLLFTASAALSVALMHASPSFW